MPTLTADQIKEIAGQLECGFSAYVHKTTGELVFIPDFDSFDLDDPPWKEEADKIENDPDD